MYVIKRMWANGKIVYLQYRGDDVAEFKDAKYASKFSLRTADVKMSKHWDNPHWTEEVIRYE
jgi:hypothetical protein